METMKCPSCGSPSLSKISSSEYICDSCKAKSTLSTDKTFLIIKQGNLCPSCGFINDTGVKFCGNCGGVLVKYCNNCGNEVRQDLKFCPNCGNKFVVGNINHNVKKKIHSESSHLPKNIHIIITGFHKHLFEVYSTIRDVMNYRQESEVYKNVHNSQIDFFVNQVQLNELKEELAQFEVSISIIE